MRKILALVFMVCFVFMGSACASMDNKSGGALHGALIGGAAGGAVASPTLVGIAVGVPAGAVFGLVAGNEIDRQGPMYYTDACNSTKCYDVISKPFQADKNSDEWYVVLEKDDELVIAKKPLKANKWTTVQTFKK